MKKIIDIKVDTETVPNYIFYHITYGKLKMSVTTRTTTLSVTVRIMNASNAVWGGLGKDFPSLQMAIDNYKNPKIKECLESIKIKS